MFAVNIYANALTVTDRMQGTKHVSEVSKKCDFIYRKNEFDWKKNKKKCNCFKGIGRTCTYDSHCISNAYCKAQVMCACKAEYPLESEDKWYCDGNKLTTESECVTKLNCNNAEYWFFTHYRRFVRHKDTLSHRTHHYQFTFNHFTANFFDEFLKIIISYHHCVTPLVHAIKENWFVFFFKKIVWTILTSSLTLTTNQWFPFVFNNIPET